MIFHLKHNEQKRNIKTQLDDKIEGVQGPHTSCMFLAADSNTLTVCFRACCRRTL